MACKTSDSLEILYFIFIIYLPIIFFSNPKLINFILAPSNCFTPIVGTIFFVPKFIAPDEKLSPSVLLYSR